MKNLLSHKWDEKRDLLFTSEGEPVSMRLKLESHTPSGGVHYWDKKCWPRDIYFADSPVDGTSPSELKVACCNFYG